MLAAESRSVMNEWVHAIRASGTTGPTFYEVRSPDGIPTFNARRVVARILHLVGFDTQD